MKLRQKLGQEAFNELNKLIKHKIDVRKIAGDYETHKMALTLLLEWIQSVYELDERQQAELEDDGLDLNQMFKLRN